MANQITDFWHSVTSNRAVVLLGEDHMGAWSHTTVSEDAIDAVVNWHDRKKNGRIILWHEGEDQSQSFKRFVAWFKSDSPTPPLSSHGIRHRRPCGSPVRKDW